jgi:hypothetical protein
MFISLVASLTLACGSYGEPSTTDRALDGDEDAIAELRDAGQDGLDELIERRAALGVSDPRWDMLIDRVAGQRYATHSRLFWYTDLEAAKAEAKRAGKGILSLRLLGRLDEDFSCANSRFFRTMLYPDPTVVAVLRKHYVLHWESVANAPKVTVDFGNGRVLTRTITGNSLHYVLSAHGEVVDVMPGLVGPDAFAMWLATAVSVTRELAAAPSLEVRDAAIAAHRNKVHATLLAQWKTLLQRIGVKAPQSHSELLAVTTPSVLETLAEVHSVRLSKESRALVESLMPPAPDLADGALGFRPRLAFRAMPIAIGKSRAEQPILDKLDGVVASLVRDELNNAYSLRARALMIAVGAPVELATQGIYAELFRTPLDDPWMGMAPLDVFTALPVELERREVVVGRAR